MGLGVRVSMLAAVVVGLLGGCASTEGTSLRPAEAVSAAPTPPSHGPEGWGTTRIVLRDNLTWPYTLSQVHVVVDGVMIYSEHDPATALIGVLQLEPGDHTVAVHIVTAYASAPLSDPGDCQVTLRATQSFRVDFSPARLELDLHLRGVTENFAERVDLAIDVQGAEVLEHHVVPHPQHELHTPDSPEAIVRGIEMRVEQARTRRDVIAVLCYEDKLSQARVALRLVGERREALRYPGSEQRARHQRTIIAVLEHRMSQLWLETQSCISHGDYYVEALRTVEVSDEIACSGHGPLIELQASSRF